METRKVNVMGKEVQIPKDMTFGELAKEFEGEVFGKILVAKQGEFPARIDLPHPHR